MMLSSGGQTIGLGFVCMQAMKMRLLRFSAMGFQQKVAKTFDSHHQRKYHFENTGGITVPQW